MLHHALCFHYSTDNRALQFFLDRISHRLNALLVHVGLARCRNLWTRCMLVQRVMLWLLLHQLYCVVAWGDNNKAPSHCSTIFDLTWQRKDNHREMMIQQNVECILCVCQEMMRSKSYTASSDAGPSSTAVIPSTVTVAGSLATYLESPLLYSFPEQRASIWSVKHQFDTQHDDRAMVSSGGRTYKLHRSSWGFPSWRIRGWRRRSPRWRCGWGRWTPTSTWADGRSWIIRDTFLQISSHQWHGLRITQRKKKWKKLRWFWIEKVWLGTQFQKPIRRHSEDLGNLVQRNYVSERGDGRACSCSDGIRRDEGARASGMVGLVGFGQGSTSWR